MFRGLPGQRALDPCLELVAKAWIRPTGRIAAAGGAIASSAFPAHGKDPGRVRLADGPDALILCG